jgi:hypothetical protein
MLQHPIQVKEGRTAVRSFQAKKSKHANAAMNITVVEQCSQIKHMSGEIYGCNTASFNQLVCSDTAAII